MRPARRRRAALGAALVLALAALLLVSTRAGRAPQSAAFAPDGEAPAPSVEAGRAARSPSPDEAPPAPAREPAAIPQVEEARFRLEVLGPTGRPFRGAPPFVFLGALDQDRARLRELAASFETRAAFDLNRAWKEGAPPRAGFADERFDAPASPALLLVAARDGAGLALVELAPPIPELVRVRLEAERHVTVRVLTVEGAPVPEVWCHLRSREASEEPGSGDSLSAAYSDAEGLAVLALPSGALDELRPDELLEVWTHLPPNRSAAAEVPSEALEDGRELPFVLPAFGSVELRTRALPGGPEKLALQLQELRPGVDPEGEGSTIHIVRAGASYVFERVPVGTDLLALAGPWGGGVHKGPSLHLAGPRHQGERVVATVP